MGKLAKVLGQVEKAVERKRLQAYHGTPHDVDKFSMDKIGTGEGAQAYGHGLYFAEDVNVAKQYEKALSANRTTIDNKPVSSVNVPELEGMSELSTLMMRAANFDKSEALKKTQSKLDDAMKSFKLKPNTPKQRKIDDLKQVKKEIEAFDEARLVKHEGNLYKVELDIDPDTEMLDWDLPLSEQPESVQKVFKSYFDEMRANASDESIPVEQRPVLSFIDRMENEYTGGDLYKVFGEGTARSAEILNKAGIKGIRYDDGFSRGKEGGTKNFVVFDDSLISIAERNGIPIERVDEVAQSQGVSRQQALASLIGGSTGIALMGGGERAEASMMNTEPQEPIQRQFEQERQASYAKQKQFFDNFSARRLARKAAKTAIGTGEAALTIGSGLANESAAGLAGLYGAATGQNPADIIQHFQENPSLYLPQTEEGMAQLEGLQGLIDDTVKYWGPRGGTQAIQNFKQSQDYLNTQGAKIDPSLGAGMATALGLLPEVL